MLRINRNISLQTLSVKLERVFELSANKIRSIEKDWQQKTDSPVYTIKGKYTSRGWTEWTQGFRFGCAILQFEATGEDWFLQCGKKGTLLHMAPHISNTGAHDHGFNNISTYGNLLRLMEEGRIPHNPSEMEFYKLALKTSGAIQASRWTELKDGLGYIHSFNGAHSLFCDTIRSLRVLFRSHQLGHALMAEQDQKINLLHRGVRHLETTARYNVYFGKNRDLYDVPGRVAHETIFNPKSKTYRSPGTQQGYSPFSTWTRGQAWILTGFAEQLEFLASLDESEFEGLECGTLNNKEDVLQRVLEVATTVANGYINQSPSDGIPYWDTGAPGLARLDGYLDRPADPFNPEEPVDSSAAAIAAQGFVRLGLFLQNQGQLESGQNYLQFGLSISDRLFEDPYLSTDHDHQGLILHSVYHRPNQWDYVPEHQKVPCGESSMWGDYHALELAIQLWKLAKEREQEPLLDDLR